MLETGDDKQEEGRKVRWKIKTQGCWKWEMINKKRKARGERKAKDAGEMIDKRTKGRMGCRGRSKDAGNKDSHWRSRGQRC